MIIPFKLIVCPCFWWIVLLTWWYFSAQMTWLASQDPLQILRQCKALRDNEVSRMALIQDGSPNVKIIKSLYNPSKLRKQLTCDYSLPYLCSKITSYVCLWHCKYLQNHVLCVHSNLLLGIIQKINKEPKQTKSTTM